MTLAIDIGIKCIELNGAVDALMSCTDASKIDAAAVRAIKCQCELYELVADTDNVALLTMVEDTIRHSTAKLNAGFDALLALQTLRL
jgi:hypothetical protein